MPENTLNAQMFAGSKDLPTRAQCIDLLRNFSILGNIERHCVAVATVAYYIGLRLTHHQPCVNLDLLFNCSLLHDLGKAATIRELDPDRYAFAPLDDEKQRRLAKLHHLHDSLQALYSDLVECAPVFGKAAHEIDVTRILAGHNFPFLNYHLAHIGGTKEPAYLDAAIEVQISHYADWRLQGTTLVPLTKRLDYLFSTYASSMSDHDRRRRVDLEKQLENTILANAGDTLDFDLISLNELKHALFDSQYDYFEIDVDA